MSDPLGSSHASDLAAELTLAAESIRTEAAARDPWLADLPVAGIGWATVELDRAARELQGAGPFGTALRDVVLGASARRSPIGKERRPTIALLEPDTEGLLAAALARFGEGVLAIYLGPLDRADVAGRLRQDAEEARRDRHRRHPAARAAAARPARPGAARHRPAGVGTTCAGARRGGVAFPRGLTVPGSSPLSAARATRSPGGPPRPAAAGRRSSAGA